MSVMNPTNAIEMSLITLVSIEKSAMKKVLFFFTCTDKSEKMSMASSYFNDVVDKNIGFVRTNTLVRATLGTLLIMYASYVVPNLDVQTAKYTSNTWVRLLIIGLVAFTTRHDTGLALLMGAAFMFTTDHLFQRGLNSARLANSAKDVVRAAMHPFGDHNVKPVVEWIDARPSDMKIPNEFSDNNYKEGDGLQPYVPDDTEQLAAFES